MINFRVRGLDPALHVQPRGVNNAWLEDSASKYLRKSVVQKDWTESGIFAYSQPYYNLQN